MKISIVGTGYVGLVTGTCFSEIGHTVTCIEKDQAKLEKLKKGVATIYELGLQDMLSRNINAKRLLFSSDFESTKNCDAMFIAVGTPSTDEGNADLTAFYSVLETVHSLLKKNGIVVIKSTVPIGTSSKVMEFLKSKKRDDLVVVNNPEFLKEGAAIADFMKPDRVVVGTDNEDAKEVMKQLYAPLVRQGNPIFFMSNISAELTKYAANCFLATKISFINDMARLCDAIGADVEELRQGIGSDVRIGKHFLYPGPGYGGSCFPKDVRALLSSAKEFQLDLPIVRAAEKINEEVKHLMAKKFLKYFSSEKYENLKVAIWGLAFKANTDDVRETAAYSVVEDLVSMGVKEIRVYDPMAMENFKNYLPPKYHSCVHFISTADEAVREVDALFLLTEWTEFRNPDLSAMGKSMKRKIIFDGRNMLNSKEVLKAGFEYLAHGKKIN
ncbi:MAG: UDP-glucose/GDP-mannose dehydrogenase family protein [Bacteriovoracaceae bacterium]|nr:UDP-glucose/GDP-mannose dehydrogenase family protein [Bacteriovoracaceae bacterium]